MFKSQGQLRYSPQSRGSSDSKHWVILDCDPEIGRYYRYLYFKASFEKLQKPAWECHVTVVRNEPPLVENLWQKYDGKTVEFDLIPSGGSDGLYFWLNVECDFLLDLREELGLPRLPIYPFHLTFGNSK